MISIETLSPAAQVLLDISLRVLPNLIVAVGVVVVGWIFGWLVERLLRSIFNALPFFDEALKNIGAEKVLERAGLRVNLGTFFGVIFKVFIMFAFLVAALEILGLESVNMFLTEKILLGFIPNVVSAALIVVIGLIVANFVANLLMRSARVMKVDGGLASKIAKWSIVVLSAMIALGELGIAPEIIQSVIVGVIAAISLALGLAFGLGGQQTASDFLNRVKNDMGW